MLFMSQRLQFTYIAKYLVFALLLFLYKSGLAQPCASNLLNIGFDFQQNCNTKTIQFTNTSVINSGTITSYNWNFGDGNFSTINNPQHTYLNYGVYLVSLSLTHSSGCTSIVTDSVTVLAPPTADFSFNFDSVCPNQLITFTNLSTGNGLTYKWFFRDGPNYNAISNTAINPSHYFNAAIGSGFQTFNIKLEAKDMYGCIDSITQPLVVKQQPFVDFSENGNFRRCENVIGSISDTAIIYNYSNLSDIAGYEVNWGDGGGFIPVTSTFNNTVPLTHVYNSINNFPIQIKATGINGCVNTFKDTFEIISIPLPDFSSLSFSAGCAPFSVYTVNNSSGITSNTLTYINWGDNTIDTLATGTLGGDTLYHTYTSTTCINNSQQPYNIVLTTKNECGAPFKSYGPVEVYAPPQSNVNINIDSVCVGNPVVFQNQSIPNFCAANPRTLYTWNFGDSVSTSVLAPLNNPTPGISHIYNQPGIYNVTLIAENTSPASTGKPGCGSTIDSVKVYIFETYADFSFNRVCLGDTTQFTNLSLTPGGTINSVSWNFGDGTTSTQLNPVHIYQNPGMFTVKLSIISSLSCEDIKYDTVIVDSLPKAAFSFTNTCFGDSTFFTNLSSANSDSISSVHWDFGDGYISSMLNPVHLFQDTGLYNVTLSVYNSNNCKNDTTIVLKVFANPIASFYTDTICAGYQRIFTNNSIGLNGNIVAYQWNMGDGIGSCNQIDTTYSYAGSGTYPVFLKVTDINTCTDDTTINIYLGPVPQADFSFDTVCFGSPTHFSNSSNDNGVPIANYSWSFGDGNNASNASPNHTYASQSNYNVSLKVSNVNSCSDSITKIITIYSLPFADFSNNTVCQGDTTFFTQLSTSSNSNLIAWNWNFGDGNSDTTLNPVHQYQNNGNYIVNLNITDANGCNKDSSKTVIVRSLPQPSFTLTHPCLGQAAGFAIAASVPAYTNQIWNFGTNNDSSILANPNYTFNQTGNYNVKLSVTDVYGCNGDTTQTIFISPLPIANFSFDTVCFGDSTSFIDLSFDSTTNITTWSWSFGDNSTSTDTNAIHLYNNSGYFTANLKVTNFYGCFDSISKQLIVDSIPFVNFTTNNVCLGNINTFNDLSQTTGAIINNWQWNYGDGNTDTIQNPQHTYLSSGVFNVNLNVTKSNGCSNDTTISLLVHKLPKPDFSVNSVCVNNSLTFYANDTATMAVNWQWNFGDGTTDSIQNPNHTYYNSGNYNINLLVSDTNLCEADTTKSIFISPLPVADFSFDTSCLGNAIIFTDNSTDSSGVINSWNWNFGDSTISNLNNPNHFYTLSGNYNVILTISNLYGCTDSILHTVLVDSLPLAAFSSNNVTIGGTNIFNDNSIANATNLLSWQWNFGDGNTSNLQNPQHTYSQADTFNVSLIVVNSNGCEDTLIQNVIVFPLPDPDFTVAQACMGDSSYFYDNSSSLGGNIVSWKWYFGDGDSISSQNPVHKYSNSGSYTVWLIVKDINGSIDSISHIAIVNSNPIADFISDTVCFGLQTSFADSSVSTSGTINQWKWNFGDGQISTLQNPQHQYNTEGVFIAVLKVTDTNLCFDSISYQVLVDSLPRVDFLQQAVCLHDTSYFFSLATASSDSISSVLWNFGDGNISNLSNPVHLYQNSGNYMVNLNVVNSNGCTNDSSKSLKIYQLPVADFSYDTACIGFATFFSDSSYSTASSISNYFWSFGDSLGTSVQKNPAYIYSYSTGILQYNVNLDIKDSNSCKANITKTVIIHPQPIAGFTFTQACSGFPTQFTDTSSSVGTQIVSRIWNFGDGTAISTLQNPQHQYTVVNSTTNYTVSLIITDAFGCKDTISKSIIVYPPVIAEFISDTVCNNSNVQLIDISQSAAGSIISWNWNFGNGSGTSNLQFPNFAYTNVTNNTLFNVRLIVSDTLGCTDSVYHPLLVHPQPVVHFRADTSCLGINTYFTDSTYSNGGSLSAWSWNFQGLGTSTAQNPVFLFPSWGVYNTTLTVTDVNGCNASITIPVTVDSIPEVNFNYHGNCASGLINFTDISIPHGTANSSWHWNFGDSYSSSLQNPVHFYTAVDTFNVTLTVGNSNGCQGSFSKQIYVNPSMTYEFYADTVCIGFATHFTDSFLINTSQISTWLWNFGDGSTATIHNPQHIYNNPGIYNVSLTVVDTAGCVETINHNIKVNAKPIVDFTSDYACLGDSSHFTNNSFSSSGISNNIWKFGDGGSSLISNPAHLYNNAGIFTAKLIIENNNGCIDSVEKSVNVINRPIAGFSVSNVCSNFPVIITDTSTALSSFISTWKWNFGDGDSLFISNPGLYTPNISHTYNNPGNYIIKLLISNNVCSDTAIRNIEVYHNPVAAFSVPDNCLNQNTLFSDTSVIAGYPIVSRLWSFGDGGNSNLQYPAHLYSNSGNYIATLSITDSRGCVGYASRNLNIYPLPQANFTNSQTCFHDSTQFTDLSFGNGGNIINRIWNFGDLTAASSLQNPKHYYNAPKNYSVSLIIKNSNQCIDTVIHNITVDSLPQANFTNTTVCQGNQTIFTNTSVNHGSINNSWSWKFGDNIGVSVLQNPFYTYQNHGIFNAKLLVTNQMGCKDSVIKAVQVDTIPLANFKADSACLGLPTHFTNLSQSYGNLSMTYLWNFGDNTATSTLINPTHIYNSPGNYLVSLTVTDTHGCSKSVVKNIVVYNLPVAGFTTTPTQFPASTSFTNTSAAVANTSIINWNWNFGNGIGTSTIQNPVYTYPSADTFNVRLIVTDNHGCKDTVINPVIVYLPFIHANFGFTTACQNSNTLFSDSTIIGSGNGILSWNWSFGDSTSSNLQNPIHQYANPGTYQVQLKVTGIGGIRDSITKTVIVYPKPIADFDNSGVCIGVNKTFTNLSSVITGNIISWNWSFGNGNTANTLNHNTVYNVLGNYPVKLIVKTDNGCIDSINKITKVHPLPTISFSSDITEGCVPIFVSFKDSSLVDSGFITNWIWDFGDGSTANTSTNITSHSYLTAGNYNVSVTARSNNTCVNTLTIPFMISVYPNPHADFDVTPNTTSMLDSKIQFSDFSNGVSYWNWYFGDGDSSHVQHPTHIYNNPGDYYPLLLVTTAQGCTDTISKRVVILKDATFYAPSAFTPNNDSYNDVFQVYGIDLEKGKFEMMIFNRWGEMVFHSEDYNYGWNGSMYGNKEACPDGTYVWKIRYTDGLGRYQTAYGHVTLIR